MTSTTADPHSSWPKEESHSTPQSVREGYRTGGQAFQKTPSVPDWQISVSHPHLPSQPKLVTFTTPPPPSVSTPPLTPLLPPPPPLLNRPFALSRPHFTTGKPLVCLFFLLFPPTLRALPVGRKAKGRLLCCASEACRRKPGLHHGPENTPRMLTFPRCRMSLPHSRRLCELPPRSRVVGVAVAEIASWLLLLLLLLL